MQFIGYFHVSFSLFFPIFGRARVPAGSFQSCCSLNSAVLFLFLRLSPPSLAMFSHSCLRLYTLPIFRAPRPLWPLISFPLPSRPFCYFLSLSNQLISVRERQYHHAEQVSIRLPKADLHFPISRKIHIPISTSRNMIIPNRLEPFTICISIRISVFRSNIEGIGRRTVLKTSSKI